MVEAIQKDGKTTWLDQIRNRFLHPTSESFVAYGNTVLGEDDEDDVDGTSGPTREEVIVLSSEGSDRSFEGLTLHSVRAGRREGLLMSRLMSLLMLRLKCRLRLLNSWRLGERKARTSQRGRRKGLRKKPLKLLEQKRNVVGLILMTAPP
ncbi:hypothetical protein HanPI659440_Chr05g0209401 [Helianthus annuus]|nr:hypothetical protein HanPI659440_Chr05g0209401 [Helianthus annuus]